jgi:hypothetical protein
VELEDGDGFGAAFAEGHSGAADLEEDLAAGVADDGDAGALGEAEFGEAFAAAGVDVANAGDAGRLAGL